VRIRKDMQMEEKAEIKGQRELLEGVIDAGLCVNCGACVNLCAYAACWKDRTVMVHQCDRTEGRCYAFCPRTPTNLDTLRRALFDPADLTAELGSVRGFYMARAAREQQRRAAQHGGTVTTLLSLALQEKWIDGAIVSEGGEDHSARAVWATTAEELERHARSKFVASPTLAAFNEMIKDTRFERIGVVVTPCQGLALAKMRLSPLAKDDGIKKLRLVIGLFCGWAFSWRELKGLLKKKTEGRSIVGFDIPPSRYHVMEVFTDQGRLQISLDDVLPAVRKSCHYCFDMTAEFSDISVGAGRSPEGWEMARSWNQVIVRSRLGQDLVELAVSRGLLEVQEVPEGNLEKLKEASMNKKRTAIKNLKKKSGTSKDLLYLDRADPYWKKLLS
jgi:coenzyme F420 hydrogenase subunit beta